MKLNAEDGGTRRFILCTNNENGICRDVTYERIRRVIDKEDYAASLKYYKVGYVPISDRMYYEYADELLRHIRELVELENGINFTGNEEIAIVLTDEELEIFLDDEGICKRCRKLYMGHDVLLDAQQAQALQEYNIAVNVIPDYYYNSSLAHCVYNGSTITRHGHEHLHGEVVSLGVLCLLTYEGANALRDTIMKFNASIGLPVCFDDIDITEDEFDLMADRILTSTEWQYRPKDVTREKFIACMKEQNKIGQEFKKQTGSL